MLRKIYFYVIIINILWETEARAVKNKLLVITLGICTAVCTVIADYAYTGQILDERFAEVMRYEALNADPHTRYGGYSVEE